MNLIEQQIKEQPWHRVKTLRDAINDEILEFLRTKGRYFINIIETPVADLSFVWGGVNDFTKNYELL